MQTWGLRHWCDMFAKGSPNAMEVALLPPSAVVRADPLGRAAMDAAHDALHAGFIPHLAYYAHRFAVRVPPPLGAGRNHSFLFPYYA